ncbi:hypothetical protein E8E13_010201 [Curvularia kusanoi]|uniref:Transcription factor CBF/NF-Y/archaeal histone domain-containing protein n=1 Tax=Curvularia kusanoi TaxID=90978 RepID=A0A9P4WC34_CURKU|nr:hypothetical protein E8E13_010201 [Curvularia kusanoi]
MPYNNTPIAPSKEVTGTVSLPLARVQKIIQADPERLTVTKNASFAIALATEMMIQHLAVTTHNVVKTERKPRRNIQYRDVSGAVSKTDNLEFLVDVVPKTVTYGAYKKRRAAEEAEGGRAREAGEAGAPGARGKIGGVGKAKESEGSVKTGAPVVERQTGPLPPITTPAAPLSDILSPQPPSTTTATTATPQDLQPRPLLDPLSRNEVVPPVPETEAMDIDDSAPERVPDSEGEEDPAAMQIEMEMRGPIRGVNGVAPAAAAAAPPPPPPQQPQPQQPPRISSGGFTAINGR